MNQKTLIYAGVGALALYLFGRGVGDGLKKGTFWKRYAKKNYVKIAKILFSSDNLIKDRFWTFDVIRKATPEQWREAKAWLTEFMSLVRANNPYCKQNNFPSGFCNFRNPVKAFMCEGFVEACRLYPDFEEVITKSKLLADKTAQAGFFSQFENPFTFIFWGSVFHYKNWLGQEVDVWNELLSRDWLYTELDEQLKKYVVHNLKLKIW